MLSKLTQTKPWKERDPRAEQREVVKRYYVDTYGQISRDSPWRKFDERAEKEAKEKREKEKEGKAKLAKNKFPEDAKES